MAGCEKLKLGLNNVPLGLNNVPLGLNNVPLGGPHHLTVFHFKGFYCTIFMQYWPTFGTTMFLESYIQLITLNHWLHYYSITCFTNWLLWCYVDANESVFMVQPKWWKYEWGFPSISRNWNWTDSVIFYWTNSILVFLLNRFNFFWKLIHWANLIVKLNELNLQAEPT